MTDSELLARLEKLERDNRRLKRFGLAALALAGALGLIAAARPVPNVIKAHKFEVVDGAGKVRMRLEASSKGANIFIAAGSLSAPIEGQFPAVSMGANDDYSWVTLGNAEWLSTSAHAHRFVVIENSLNLTNSTSKGPQVAFRDNKGYEMSLGSTPLLTPKTGETHQTSAASIVMFGKKGSVIWQAP